MLNTVTVGEIRETVRAILQEQFPWFNQGDPLVVENVVRQLRIFYTCVRASRGCPDAAILECRVDFDLNRMWIGSIEVAPSHRLQGIGRHLAQAAEAMARAMGVQTINVYPLPSSLDFWRKTGYRPDCRTARVLCKDVVAASRDRPAADRQLVQIGGGAFAASGKTLKQTTESGRRLPVLGG